VKVTEVIAFVGFLILIGAIVLLGPGEATDAKYYFGTIGLVGVLGMIGLLAVLARKAEESTQKLYFGVIGTLLGSVIGLTGGIAGGAVSATNAGQAAAADVAVDQTKVASDAANATARRIRNSFKGDIADAVKQAVP